jgi:hypothetical protein
MVVVAAERMDRDAEGTALEVDDAPQHAEIGRAAIDIVADQHELAVPPCRPGLRDLRAEQAEQGVEVLEMAVHVADGEQRRAGRRRARRRLPAGLEGVEGHGSLACAGWGRWQQRQTRRLEPLPAGGQSSIRPGSSVAEAGRDGLC